MVRKVVLMLLVLGLVSVEAQARGRGLFRRTTRYTSTVRSSVTFSGGPQAVAEQKAERAARLGLRHHQGGSFGGVSYEGIGFGSTPQQALNNCCYSGQRRVAGQHVVQGANGIWYAVRLYY
jgi:hypothetical protein